MMHAVWGRVRVNAGQPIERPRWANRMLVRLLLLVTMLSAFGHCLVGQTSTIHFDEASRTFRLDAAGTTYVLGINPEKRLQALYWGKRLGAGDQFPAAAQMPAVASLDLPISTTPQEFVGWGGGLYVEPDLKITFPDGNRDLVLQYVSHAIEGQTLRITMKDLYSDL